MRLSWYKNLGYFIIYEREREREKEFCNVQLMRRGGRIVEHSTTNESSFAFKEEGAIKGR
jgi:hypothetical protein